MIKIDTFSRNIAMLVAVLVLLVARTSAEVIEKCSGNGETSMALTPSEDGVAARYTATWCSAFSPNMTEWRLDLWYHKGGNETKCPYSPLLRQKHSTVKKKPHFSCKNVCLYVNFDLVFTGCFGLEGTVYIEDTALFPNKTFKYIKNDFNKSYFDDIEPAITKISHETDITLHWYMGIPLAGIQKELCEIKNDSSMECAKYQDSVNKNCTKGPAVYELTCVLELPRGACYELYLHHDAYWTEGVFHNKAYIYDGNICGRGAGVRVQAAGRRWALWAAAGALLAAAALVGRLLYSRITAAKHSMRALRANAAPVPDEAEGVEAAEGVGGAEGEAMGAEDDILLLYAREGPRGEAVAGALRELLQAATTGKVHDLFTRETMCAAAPAPSEWVRRAVCGPRVRVVLLETPAAALLAGGGPHPLQLERPLLAPPVGAGGGPRPLQLERPLLAPPAGAGGGPRPLPARRAVYRRPQFADGLVGYALRLLAEGPHHHRYRKYHRLCSLIAEATDRLYNITLRDIKFSPLRLTFGGKSLKCEGLTVRVRRQHPVAGGAAAAGAGAVHGVRAARGGAAAAARAAARRRAPRRPAAPPAARRARAGAARARAPRLPAGRAAAARRHDLAPPPDDYDVVIFFRAAPSECTIPPDDRRRRSASVPPGRDTKHVRLHLRGP